MSVVTRKHWTTLGMLKGTFGKTDQSQVQEVSWGRPGVDALVTELQDWSMSKLQQQLKK